MSDKRPRFTETELPVAISTTTPGVRMVAILVWANGEEAHHCFFPVVALRYRITRTYRKQRLDGDPPIPPASHRDLLRDGWRLVYCNEGMDGLYVGPEGYLEGTNDNHPCNTEVEIATCPWPESEDEERLSGRVAEMSQNALSMERWRMRTGGIHESDAGLPVGSGEDGPGGGHGEVAGRTGETPGEGR